MRPNMNPIRRSFVALAVAVGAIAVAPTGAAEAQSNGCPSVGNNFERSGPFRVETDRQSNHTYYTPRNLGSQGCDPHPVILWGNGTFTGPNFYNGLLEHYASHGFIVVAANTSNAGSGREMLQGLDNLESFNSDRSSPYYQQVDLDNVGATGHSQGGGGSINAGNDNRVDVIFPLEPWSQNQRGLDATSIFFAGGSDSIVSANSVRNRYTDVNRSMPAAYAELRGAGHLVVTGNGGGFRGPSTAWARWHLMGDSDAAEQFIGGCALCNDRNWTIEKNSQLEGLGVGSAGNVGAGAADDEADADTGGGGFFDGLGLGGSDDAADADDVDDEAVDDEADAGTGGLLDGLGGSADVDDAEDLGDVEDAGDVGTEGAGAADGGGFLEGLGFDGFGGGAADDLVGAAAAEDAGDS